MATNSEERMGWGDLVDFKRSDIIALHKTWFAFFLTFFVWFNMAPLVSTIIKESGFTMGQLKLLAIANVALVVPGRVITGMVSDRLGPRRTFTGIMIIMAIPCFAFAFSTSYTQMLISRLILSMVGTGFVVGIHMTSLWFKPRDMGFAQGVEAGLGNWGSSIAAITIPFFALNVFGSWRYAVAFSGVIMLAYGFYYWFAITDGPPGSVYHKPRKGAAIEVSTWGDMINAIAWTIPVIGILAVLVWRIQGMGYMSSGAAIVAYIVIAAVVLYQVIQIIRFNTPILKKGVPEDDKYRFTDVACLCCCYASTFGVELAIISMLPMFFQKHFHLTPQMAGLIGSLFAFMNFFARSLGGFISDRAPSRRGAMLIYLVGITICLVAMSFINASWPLPIAVIVVIVSALFVTGGCGTTYALAPLIKRRITGQISGYIGAFGSVGAVLYLTVYTFVNDQQFFWFIGAVVLATFLFCLFLLKEPAGAFSQEYQLSSVDKEMMQGGGH